MLGCLVFAGCSGETSAQAPADATPDVDVGFSEPWLCPPFRAVDPRYYSSFDDDAGCETGTRCRYAGGSEGTDPTPRSTTWTVSAIATCVDDRWQVTNVVYDGRPSPAPP